MMGQNRHAIHYPPPDNTYRPRANKYHPGGGSGSVGLQAGVMSGAITRAVFV